ncbi:MAG: polyhydroxyalkanoate synthesis regulator DNA-binding domain-containing protein [candidate division WOR-3 bacterium]
MKRLIKRYRNRKLYDVYSGSFVNLLDLAQMIRSGDELVIIEHETKKDITDFVLIQVIIELIKNQARKVSLSRLLHSLIKANWTSLHHILKVLLASVPTAKFSETTARSTKTIHQKFNLGKILKSLQSSLAPTKSDEVRKLKAKIAQPQKELKNLKSFTKNGG